MVAIWAAFCKPNSPLITKVLTALSVHPVKSKGDWTDRIIQARRSEGLNYYGICPLCKSKEDNVYSSLLIKGPFNEKLSFDPRCIHTKPQILVAAGLTTGDVYDGDSDLDVLPGVMPKLPSSQQDWSTHDEDAAREMQFLSQLPKKGNLELFQQVVQRYIAGNAGGCESKENALKSLLPVAKRWDLSISEADLNVMIAAGGEQCFVSARFKQYKERAAQRGLVLKPFEAHADERPEWVIQDMLAAGLPAILGGPMKTLKTGVAIELGVSAASGLPFLGVERFSIPRRRRVAIFSGENGGFILHETALRIARSKGLASIPDEIRLCDRLPRLSNDEDLEVLQASLAEFKAEVVIIDPMYLSLLEGTKVQASNLLEMGPLLRRLADACLAISCQPLLVHHDNRQVKVGAAPQLGDLAFSGFGEFARQWLLTNRRRPYKDGSGHHELLLAHGGCFGRDGLLAVDIDEGQIRDDFTGRTWVVSVRTPEEARQKTTEERLARADQKVEETVARTAEKILVAIEELEKAPGDPVGLTKVRAQARLNGETMRQGVAYLVAQKQIEELDSFSLPGSRKPGSALKRLRV
jgi:hypothetical protein